MLLSVPGWTGLISLGNFLFFPPLIFTVTRLPQLWRLATAFLITGPKLSMIMDPYLLYSYCSTLETTVARFSQPGDFFMYLIFVCSIILVSAFTSCATRLASTRPPSPPTPTPRISARTAIYQLSRFLETREIISYTARATIIRNTYLGGTVECRHDGIPH